MTMRRMHASCWVCLLGVLSVAMAGCGGSGLGTVSASGKVTLDGQPLGGAAVAFQPAGPVAADQPSAGATALTEEDGTFSLTTPPNISGALPGIYTVRIMKLAMTDGSAIPVMDPDTGDEEAHQELLDKLSAEGKLIAVVPQRYNVSTELTAEIPKEGKTDLNFDLQSGQ